MRYAPPDAEILVREGRSRLYISWTAVDADTFHDVKDSFRAYFSVRDATWLTDEKAWSIPRFLQPRLERWLAAHAIPDRVTWERDDTGARSSRDERAEARPPASLAGAYALLHLRPTAPPEVVHAVHRALSKLHHPDAGGDTLAMAAINRAVELINEYRTVGAA